MEGLVWHAKRSASAVPDDEEQTRAREWLKEGTLRRLLRLGIEAGEGSDGPGCWSLSRVNVEVLQRVAPKMPHLDPKATSSRLPSATHGLVSPQAPPGPLTGDDERRGWEWELETAVLPNDPQDTSGRRSGLTGSQEMVLKLLVEASRATPSERRQPFEGVLDMTVARSPLMLLHPGVPKDHPEVQLSDIEALAAERLVLLKRRSSSYRIQVAPAGFRYYDQYLGGQS